MINKLITIICALCFALLSACSSPLPVIKNMMPDPDVLHVLNSKNNWNFKLATNKYMNKVTARIHYLSEQKINNQELDALLYYLRGFSYYADIKTIDKINWQQLENALSSLKNSGFLNLNNDKNARLVEHYAVTLYRFYNHNTLSTKIAPHLETLSKLVLLEYESDNFPSQYAHWETLRAMAFLTYEAKKNKTLANAILTTKNWLPSLKSIAQKTGWQREHALWALAYQHKILADNARNKLDNQVWHLLDKTKLTLNEKQFLFSQRYLINSYRGLSECENDFKGKCSFPTIDSALPINHKCSDRLFIRANHMSEKQLQQSCNKLTSQESHFHKILATKNLPTANDHNQSLRVVIFDNYSQYNQYGQMIFDINTDNGGMYIEGTPSDPNNQATFYSYEVFWQGPEFKVWNLNHEYVHYLDGRFSKYGSFGHYPSHLVWWSEGLAELISKKNVNPKAYKEAKETSKDKWPTLQDIFATTYDDGSKRVYQWSYLAIHYLTQVDLKGVQTLSQHLKNDFFKGYTNQLDLLAKKHQTGFIQFLDKQLENHIDEKAKQDIAPKKLYRYLYRDYLMPKTLQISKKHNHIL
ncbi:collagenase [Pseudoalteromonas denitrificans]|uniref:Microbial collagenase n=1 Tax=Pseudoalteromonas denitrificans DSM 6059 TaxID=1123010 RepID=A0A1I1IYI3_9GAMM|nr:collagenase [Pseudoalteromonas denitrificans]SFC38280.1 microbial collagenase [Pseudoalteromonas denitrificans DSM 6059]